MGGGVIYERGPPYVVHLASSRTVSVADLWEVEEDLMPLIHAFLKTLSGLGCGRGRAVSRAH